MFTMWVHQARNQLSTGYSCYLGFRTTQNAMQLLLLVIFLFSKGYHGQMQGKSNSIQPRPRDIQVPAMIYSLSHQLNVHILIVESKIWKKKLILWSLEKKKRKARIRKMRDQHQPYSSHKSLKTSDLRNRKEKIITAVPINFHGQHNQN